MSRRDKFPHSYQEAAAYLGHKDSRPLANNTRVIRHDAEQVGVKLHRTVVVMFHVDGSAELNTGGWNTVTTRDRINATLGRYGGDGLGRWSVGTERGSLYLYRREDGAWDRSGCPESVCTCHDETATPYYCSACGCSPTVEHSRYAWEDGVTIRPDGTTDAKPAPKRKYTPRPHRPDCRCAVHGGSTRRRYHGSYTPVPATVSDSGDGDTSCFEKPEGVPALSWAEYNRKFNDLLRGGKS